MATKPIAIRTVSIPSNPPKAAKTTNQDATAIIQRIRKGMPY